jgi:hypothetical protein
VLLTLLDTRRDAIRRETMEMRAGMAPTDILLKDEVGEAVRGFLASFRRAEVVDLVSRARRERVRSPHAFVMHGEGPAGVDMAHIRGLVAQLAQQGRATVTIEELDKSEPGRKLLQELGYVVKPFVAAGYDVCDARITMGKNGKPLRQDARTESCVFRRRERDAGHYPDQALCYGRVLVDLATFARPVVFSCGISGETLLSTGARYVFMDAAAAGSGCCSNVFHRRVATGNTFSFDVAMPLPSTAGLGRDQVTDLVKKWFGREAIQNLVNRGLRAQEAEKMIAEECRASEEAAKIRAASFESVGSAEPHCGCCGALESAATVRDSPNDVATVLCGECSARLNNSGGPISTFPFFIDCASDCPGCHPRVALVQEAAAGDAAIPSSPDSPDSFSSDDGVDAEGCSAARSEPHCFYCGALSRLGFDRKRRGESYVRICFACDRLERGGGRLERVFKCPSACSGCKWPWPNRLSFNESAARRFADIPPGIRGIARDDPHCNHCGTRSSACWRRGPALEEAAEPLTKKTKCETVLRLCSPCGQKMLELQKRGAADTLERIAQCPSECTGCKM